MSCFSCSCSLAWPRNLYCPEVLVRVDRRPLLDLSSTTLRHFLWVVTTQMKVLVTAFGPFEGHPTNASSLALDLLKEDTSWIPSSSDITFEALSVEYEGTQSFLKEYWETEKPDITIHMGVNPGQCVAVECQCNETVYTREDVAGKTPAPETWAKKESSLPLEEIVIRVGDGCVLSRDAGTYLCQFSLHCSLMYGNGKSVFLHVPPVATCATDATANTVKRIICEIIASQE